MTNNQPNTKFSFSFITDFLNSNISRLTNSNTIQLIKGYTKFTDTYKTKAGKVHRIKFILYYNPLPYRVRYSRTVDYITHGEACDILTKTIAYINSLGSPNLTSIPLITDNSVIYTLLVRD